MNDKHLSMAEPIGNTLSLTKIERIWSRAKGPFQISRSRVVRHSPVSGISFSPLVYILNPIALNLEMPSDAWIAETLGTFVRDEFTEENIALEEMDVNDYVPSGYTQNHGYLEDSFLEKFVKGSDQFFKKRRKAIVLDNQTPENIAAAVYSLLTDGALFGNENSKNNELEDFTKNVLDNYHRKDRLMFIIPAFPFKDQNFMRIPYGDASIPDLAEISFLVRLHELSESINHLYPYGSDFVILSDGELYGSIFEIKTKQVDVYQERLRHYRNILNFQGSISIISLADIIENADVTLREFIRKVKDRLKYIYFNEIDNYPNLKERFNNLVTGMRRNMNSYQLLADDIPISEAYKILNNMPCRLEYKKQQAIFKEKCLEAAFKYAAVNLVLRFTNLEKQLFPNAIRATIHPKKGQFSLTANAGGYPWNGVPYSEKWPHSVSQVKIYSYSKLIKEKENVRLICFKDTGLPCFFTSEPQFPNIEKAKEIAPVSKWDFSSLTSSEFARLKGFSCRPFTMDDLDALCEIGINDPDFIWERKTVGREYFVGLIQYRINHYQEYDFGVCALLDGDKLIGQFGLQVMENSLKEKVEVVIYLSKEYRGKGYGTLLMKAIRQMAQAKGMSKLYATVRQDDEASKAVLKKLGVLDKNIVGTQVYFHQISWLYKII